MNLKEQFDKLLAFENESEQLVYDARMLAFQFLSRIDKAMLEQKISKKELALRIGTSPSFITQLFRGDRKPNWSILSKMQKELDLQFKVYLDKEIEEMFDRNILEYHRKWSKTREYERKKGLNEDMSSVLSIEDYALAI